MSDLRQDSHAAFIEQCTQDINLVQRLAPTLASYYQALLDAGLPTALAQAMTQDCHHIIASIIAKYGP